MTAPPAFAKSTICWLEIDGRDWPAWYVAVGDTAYIVSGAGEQELPDLPATLPITLRVRTALQYAGKFEATADRLRQGDEAWDEAVGALRPARLNSTGDDQVGRWVGDGVVWAVRPDFEHLLPFERNAPSGAREPTPTPATTRVPIPRHLGGRRRRAG
ncbi:MAG: hypothetical protein M3Y49_20575 [Actinomycetota bacterium]|nr:hypothetical protein [Actinomycetota bacterium]